ncbi:MAG: PstS family phosphate ABC transporter substrate-binding protein [Anaerolineales bacterium]|nr:PstS family phosphate ABC transporter substrate-binding protein [Anaerolineales bacterium]
MFKSVRLFVFMLVTLSLVLAACGGSTSNSGSAPAATASSSGSQSSGDSSAPAAGEEELLPIALPALPEPDEVTGDIITAGSSTVFPVSERMAELFQQEGYNGNITVDSIGSGAGYERFCTAGESDIANASRPIRQSEVDNCRAIGREPLEFRVGTDALAIVVSSQNDFLTSISIEELAKVFSGEVTNWNELNPAYPDGKISVYSPGSDSGTFDYFIEVVMTPAYGDQAEAALLGLEGVQLSEDDNVLVQGVAGDPFAIGYFGYAYYVENTSRLKALNVNDVEPSQANVDNASYPLARPLFIYSDATIMQEKPQVAAFIAFYLNNLDDNIVDVGYFPAPAKAIYSSWGAWLAAVGAPEVNADVVTGDIITAGSSTVFPVSERMAELFQQEGYNGNITVDSIGSGAGYERFCVAGETDIANASRPIRDSEVESCRAIGREPLEFRVGTDALAVVVSSQNDFLTALSLEELGRIFSGEAKLWSDINPAYPAEAIKTYSPGSDSGTFDYFVEEVMEDFGGEEAILGLEGIQLSEDDNVLVQGVAGDPYAIGYFGYAYFVENQSTLKALAIIDVEPSQANVDNGSYPLARPLFIYSTASIMQEKPQVAAFIAFYLNNLDDNIVDVGYFPAPIKAIYSSWGAWYAAVR